MSGSDLPITNESYSIATTGNTNDGTQESNGFNVGIGCFPSVMGAAIASVLYFSSQTTDHFVNTRDFANLTVTKKSNDIITGIQKMIKNI